MRSIAFSVAILVLVVGRSFGEEFLELGNELHPNHLVPMRSSMQEKRRLLGDYDELLVKYLFVTDGGLGRMLVRPSFSPEFCLSVDIMEPTGTSDSKEEDRYTITVTVAVNRIWRARREAERTGEPMDVKIERFDREISRDLAVAIQRVWAKALLLTRYPAPTEETWTCFDGTTYQFSVSRGGGLLEGQTWSPKRSLPLDLTNIGLELVAFARSDEESKKTTEAQLIEKLRKLESTIPPR